MIEIEKMSKDGLEQAIKKHEEILQSKQLKIKKIKPSKKKGIIKKAITILAISGGITLLFKLIGFGYPFYKDDVKKCAEVTYEIDSEGNKEEIDREYNYIEQEGLIGILANDDDDKVLEVRNYSGCTNTGIDNNIRYVERYEVPEGMSKEEILDSLKKQNIDLTTMLGKPEVVKEDAKAKEQKPEVKIIQKEIDKTDYIIDKEAYRENLETSLSWIVSNAGLYFLALVLNELSPLSKLEQEEKEEEKLIRKLKLEYDKRK